MEEYDHFRDNKVHVDGSWVTIEFLGWSCFYNRLPIQHIPIKKNIIQEKYGSFKWGTNTLL